MSYIILITQRQKGYGMTHYLMDAKPVPYAGITPAFTPRKELAKTFKEKRLAEVFAQTLSLRDNEFFSIIPKTE